MDLRGHKIIAFSGGAILFLALGIGVLSTDIKERLLGSASKGLEVQSGLTEIEYASVREELASLVVERDPRYALQILGERIKRDDALARSCHALVHEIGHVAYERYADFGTAMQYQDEICNSGYLHGVIENYFSKTTDPLSSIQTVCNEYAPGTFFRWECNHGIGHGVMLYTSNDLPRSLELCDALNDESARRDCANGVLMENFNTDQKGHASLFLREDDMFYPCSTLEERHRSDCYFYAPTYYLSVHANDYDGAIKWCAGAPEAYALTCIQGVGSQSMKENINDPKFTERICMAGVGVQVRSCVHGMSGLYINHHGSTEEAETMCKQLEETNRNTCVATIAFYKALFNDI